MRTKLEVIGGELVEVKVYKPSRRRASGLIQKAKWGRDQRGAKWMAREAGQFVEVAR